MEYKVVSFLSLAVLLMPLVTGSLCHVCEMHGGVTQSFCELNNKDDPVGVRFCCLKPDQCQPNGFENCNDWTENLHLEQIYDIGGITLDLTKHCDCKVNLCATSGYQNCTECDPPSP